MNSSVYFTYIALLGMFSTFSVENFTLNSELYFDLTFKTSFDLLILFFVKGIFKALKKVKNNKLILS